MNRHERKIEIKRLRDKLEAVYHRMTNLMNTWDNKSGPLAFDKMEREADLLQDQLRTLQKEDDLDGIETSSPEYILSQMTEENKKRVANLATMLFIKDGVVPQELSSLMRRSIERDDINHIRLATQSTVTSSGGFTLAEAFQDELEKAIKHYGGVWESSRIIKTAKGNRLPYPMVNDTTNKGYIISESGDNTTDADPLVFGQEEFTGFKYSSGLIQVPNELLEDSELFAQETIPVLAERIWRATNEHLTSGNGSGKPLGILQSAIYPGSSLNDTALAYDDFVKLKHSVDPGYRGKWMFHDSVLKEAEGIKDTAGQPVFRNLDNKIILGHEYVLNNDLPEFVSGSASANDNDKTILFGDFKKYVIRMVKNMRIVRLGQRYADLDQTAFLVLLRLDGRLMNAGTNPIKYLRVSAT